MNLDAVEGKLFGIGCESYTVGSHEFYFGYAVSRRKLLTLDTGHYHPTENVADKISAALTYLPEILLHVSRGVRWDSDHVVMLNDDLEALGQELVRGNYLERTHIGLDYFDASINRVAAWTIGTRNMLKALLKALLEPTATLRDARSVRRLHGATRAPGRDQDAPVRRGLGLLLRIGWRAGPRRLARGHPPLRAPGPVDAAVKPGHSPFYDRVADHLRSPSAVLTVPSIVLPLTRPEVLRAAGGKRQLISAQATLLDGGGGQHCGTVCASCVSVSSPAAGSDTRHTPCTFAGTMHSMIVHQLVQSPSWSGRLVGVPAGDRERVHHDARAGFQVEELGARAA